MTGGGGRDTPPHTTGGGGGNPIPIGGEGGEVSAPDTGPYIHIRVYIYACIYIWSHLPPALPKSTFNQFRISSSSGSSSSSSSSQQ
jgi:hypothetical protein